MELEDSSFAALYGCENEDTNTEKSSLIEWFDQIYELPFSRFSIEDLARSCRQDLFPNYIVPRVLQVLRDDLLTGEWHQEELLASLLSLPLSFWEENVACRNELIEMFRQWKYFLAENLEDKEYFELDDWVLALEDL